MTKEDIKEIGLKGFFLGLILFASTLIYQLVIQNVKNLQVVGAYLIPIIAGYCVIGILLRWLLHLSTLRTQQFHLFSGPAAIYWIWMLGIVIMVCASLIPSVIREIVLVNTAALLLLWLADYLYLKNIAKELNSGLGYFSRVLIEDLQTYPHTEDKFMEEIQNYCKKNNLTLEIMEYGMPAKIKMNNMQYQVQLGQYYTLVGTSVYTLEFHNVLSQAKK
jgi:hypothetical protein